MPRPFSPQGEAIGLALKTNAASSRLRVLSLGFNFMRDAAACAFGEALEAQGTCGRTGPGLQQLLLFRNEKTGIRGAEGLARGIRAAGDWLHIVDCRGGPSGAGWGGDEGKKLLAEAVAAWEEGGSPCWLKKAREEEAKEGQATTAADPAAAASGEGKGSSEGDESAQPMMAATAAGKEEAGAMAAVLPRPHAALRRFRSLRLLIGRERRPGGGNND